MSESSVVPVVALLFEVDAEADTGVPASGLRSEWRGVLENLIGELRASARVEPALQQVDLLLGAYELDGQEWLQTADGLCAQRLFLQDAEVEPTLSAGQEASGVAFPNLGSALMALAGWILRRAEAHSPVLVLHVTGGRFKCCAEIERAAGIVKMACDFHGAPGVLYNVWITDNCGFSFPLGETVGNEASPTAKSLFRMSSPVGGWGADILLGLGSVRSAAARYFEAVPSGGASMAARFAGAFFADGIRQIGAGAVGGLQTCAFLMPKEGDTMDNCEDVISIRRTQGCFVISDGAGTASYSAEWARALCRHAVESPPPAFRETNALLPQEAQKEMARQLKTWLECALAYWAPEVPWERLVRPPLLNKAREGAGASLAGIEVLSDAGEDGVTIRAWALGDSCVIQLRGNRVISARPMTCSAKFSHAPALLITRPGYEEHYLRFWQSWEATLTPGDMMVLATDAFCEYVLRSFETGTEGDLVNWLDRLSVGTAAETWRLFEEFVQAKRNQGDMKNDDVGVILIRPRKYAR